MNLEPETLARELHEAAREAVAKNLVVRADIPTKGFVEWDELTEDAREGRRIQARYLLDKFNIAERILGLDGLTPGRMVHFVMHDGTHRPAVVTAVPGVAVTAIMDYGCMNQVEDAAPESGIISLTVFIAPQDNRNDAVHRTEPGVMRVQGASFDPTGTKPNTWHWMERV